MTDDERKKRIVDVLGAHDTVAERELERMDVGGFKCRALIEQLCEEGARITSEVDAKGETRYRLEK